MGKTQKIWSVGIYLRISREDGDPGESESITSQREMAKAYIARHADLRFAGEYVDDGYTGTNFERPGFRRMMEDIRAGKITCVVVKDLSRLGRNYIGTGTYLERYFPAMGLRFISINDHYDSKHQDEDTDNVLIPFKNLINDAYSRDISIKIRSQLEVKRRNGEFVGNFAAYGYQKEEGNKNHLVPDPYAAGIVRAIFDWKMEGMSCGAIAARLNENQVLSPSRYKRFCGLSYVCGFDRNEETLWNGSQVRHILKNPVYIGDLVQGKRKKLNYKLRKIVTVCEKDWVRREGMHKAVVERELFFRVQELLLLDSRIAASRQLPVFSGLVRCGGCGQSMVRRTSHYKGHVYTYLHCSTCKAGIGCSSHLIREDRLEAMVLQEIHTLSERLKAVCAKMDAFDTREVLFGEMLQAEAECERCQKILEKLFADHHRGIVSGEEYETFCEAFSRKMEEAQKKRQRTARQLEQGREDEAQNRAFFICLEMCGEKKRLDRLTVARLIDYVEVKSKREIAVHFRIPSQREV